MTKLLGALPENWPQQLYLKTDWHRFDQGGLDDIRAWHEASNAKGESPILVVVDTLAVVRSLHAVLCEALTNTQGLLSRVEAGVKVPRAEQREIIRLLYVATRHQRDALAACLKLDGLE